MRRRSEPLLLTLRCGEQRVELAPAVGGAIARFYAQHGLQQYDWMRPASMAALLAYNPEAMASFPLLPFCNRLRDGSATFQGRTLKLAPNVGGARHPLHGTGWQQAWTVSAAGPASAHLALVDAGGTWPYRFRASQQFELDADGLTLSMQIDNLDSVPMPVGCGQHPYFPRRPGTRVRATLQQMWETDAERLPTTLSRPALIAQLARSHPLAGLVLDNNFTGWGHSAHIEWPSHASTPGASLTLRAASPLDFLVLYVPDQKDYFCVEPVSNCTDWLNVRNHTLAQTGGAVLAPGASYRCQVRYDVAFDAARVATEPRERPRADTGTGKAMGATY